MLKLKFLFYLTYTSTLLFSFRFTYGLSKYDRKDLEGLREEVREMFQHAYDSYLDYAYPYDELRPLSCDGVDTWGSYSLTLIDALDTLAVMGNYTEFQRVVDIVTANANFDANINVSVFETNIRIIGGLLSAHLLSHRAGVKLVPGWPCNGPLLELAEDVARRLIVAFDTPTGMPYGTVNLQYGVPVGETTVTCTAGVGTFILELGTLSRLTGDPLFEEVALTALDALHAHRSPLGLVGNHVDVSTGRWTAQDAGIGAGVDSYYEYLAKGAILLQRPELMHMFNHGRAAIDKYLKRDDWHLWVSMSKGQVTLPVFQSLEAYWPGVLSLTGDVNRGIKSLHNYHQVWKQYGFTPEFYYIPQGEVGTNRESYPLRPELIESVMYLYRATGDPYLIEVGRDILRSIQHSAKTPCGYATIKDVRDHRKEDRMESFFLAETTKYLYLLFDPDNFLHNRGQTGSVVQTPWGECIVGAGGYIFNTEAHPIDPGALHCCSGSRQTNVQDILGEKGNTKDFKGVPLSTHQKWKEYSTEGEAEQGEESDNVPIQSESTSWMEMLKTQKDLPFSSKPHTHGVPSTQPETDTIQNTGSQVEETNDVVQQVDHVESWAEEEETEDLISSREDHSASNDSPQENSPGKRDVLPTTSSEQLQYFPKSLQEQLNSLQVAEISSQDHGKGSKKDPAVKSTKQGGPLPVLNDLESTNRKSFDSVDPGRISDADTLLNLKKESKDLISEENLSKLQLQKLKHSVGRVYKQTTMGKDSPGDLNNVFDLQPKQTQGESDDITYTLTGGSEPHNDDCWNRKTSSSALESDCTDKDNVCKLDGGDCDKLTDELSLKAKYLWLLSSTKTKFDPQLLFERLQSEDRYTRNKSWVDDHNMLSCASQHFLQRLSMSGEMFEVR